MQNNRLTFMERLSERLTSVEAILKKLDPIESLLERIALLEKNIYTTKQVFTFQEACMYIGISEKYAVQANIRQGDSALQATWQNDIFRQRRSGRMAFAEL